MARAMLSAALAATLWGLGGAALAGPATAVTGPSRTPTQELAVAKAIETAIADGDLARARRRLSAEALSPLVAATLQGRLALAEGDAALARKRFGEAMKLAPDHAPLRLLAAHAALVLGDHDDVLTLLTHPDLASSDPSIALLAAAAHDGKDDTAAAYAVLRAAARAHPDDVPTRVQLIVLCVRHERLVTARAWASTLTPADLGADLAAALLRQVRGQAGADTFAQWLAAGFPRDEAVATELAYVYAAQGSDEAAARTFARAWRLGADTARASAEHYRVAGHWAAALRMNARVRDASQRAGQRFDILFEAGKLAQAIAAGEALSSGEATARRRYNLAYAHYALGQYAEATRLARALQSSSEAERAQLLLRAMGRP